MTTTIEPGESPRLRRGTCRLRIPLLPAQNLAADGLGQLGQDLDLARALVRRHPPAAVVDQLPLTRRTTGLQADVSLHRLTPVGVRDADDPGLADRRMGVEDVLDFPRPHLEAGRVDHVLLPVDDVEPAVGVHEADVTGEQPTAGDGGVGCSPVTSASWTPTA